MVKIYKLEEPQILKYNAEKWTQEYLGYIQRNEHIPDVVKKRYSHPEIKKQLLKETNEKCAYCESKFTAVEPGDIDHIKAKNLEAHPELYVKWSNLTMACETCNRSGKRAYNNDNEPLLNPYTDDIENEIKGLGPIIYSKSRKGQISIDVLKLNRSALIERRIEKISKIDLLRRKYESETNENYKQLLLDEIKDEISRKNEYSFVLQEYCRNYGLIQ